MNRRSEQIVQGVGSIAGSGELRWDDALEGNFEFHFPATTGSDA
jgi:hypothetical protein